MKNFKVKKTYCASMGGVAYDVVLNENEQEDNRKNVNVFVKILTGIIIGFVNGFCGGGGGMMCVPLLNHMIKLPEKKSHATTLLIMLPLSIASLIVYSIGGNLPIEESLQIGIGFVLGGAVGAGVLKLISNAWLGVVFSLIIIFSGIKMIL